MSNLAHIKMSKLPFTRGFIMCRIQGIAQYLVTVEFCALVSYIYQHCQLWHV
jgi:hypothetical protein